MLRSHVPIFADAVSVDPDGAFAPAACVEEYIAGLVQVECSAEECGFVRCAADGTECFFQALLRIAAFGHGGI